MDKNDLLNLKKRYLIWLYKVTKDELDRIERKFTQIEVDKFILKRLKKSTDKENLDSFVVEFENYIANKEKDGQAAKYENEVLKPGYNFLVLKLEAIEEAIEEFLGKKELEDIKASYEKEMIERILKSTEHK